MEMEKREPYRLDQDSATQQKLPVEITSTLQMEAIFFFETLASTQRSTIRRCSSEKWSALFTDLDISVSQLTLRSTYKFYCAFCTLQAFYRK